MVLFSSVRSQYPALLVHPQVMKFNPFQSNFSANCILPSSYLFWTGKEVGGYNAQSPVHIKTHGLPRNRKRSAYSLCWLKSVLHEENRRTGSDSGAGAQRTKNVSGNIRHWSGRGKSCRTGSNLRSERVKSHLH